MFLCAFYDARVLLLLLCVVLSEQKFSYDKRTQKKQKREVDERVLSEMFGTAFFRFFVCLTLFLILQNKKGILHNTFAALTPTPPTLLVQ